MTETTALPPIHRLEDLTQRILLGDLALVEFLMTHGGADLATQFPLNKLDGEGDISLLGLALIAKTNDLMTLVLQQTPPGFLDLYGRRLLTCAGDVRREGRRFNSIQGSWIEYEALDYALASSRPDAVSWVLNQEASLSDLQMPHTPERVLHRWARSIAYGCDPLATAQLLQARFSWSSENWCQVITQETEDISRTHLTRSTMPFPLALSLVAKDPHGLIAWMVDSLGLPLDLSESDGRTWVDAAIHHQCFSVVEALMNQGVRLSEASAHELGHLLKSFHEEQKTELINVEPEAIEKKAALVASLLLRHQMGSEARERPKGHRL